MQAELPYANYCIDLISNQTVESLLSVYGYQDTLICIMGISLGN